MKLLINKTIVFLLTGFIQIYRYTFSPLVGKHCRFQPTCSAYALEALETHGPWKGSWLIIRRLAACHPWQKLGSRSGYDPVPEKHSP
jgi:uncharacterized protein